MEQSSKSTWLKKMLVGMLFLLTIQPYLIGAANAEPINVVSVNVGNVTGAPGDIVEVPVTISAPSQAIVMYNMFINYDREHLELQDISDNQSELAIMSEGDINSGSLMWMAESGGIHTEGKLFTLTFKINDDAPLEKYSITVNEDSYLSSDSGDLNATYADGSVTVNTINWTVGSNAAAHNDTVSVPVSFSNASTDIATYGLKFSFDTSKLEAISVTPTYGDSSVECDESASEGCFQSNLDNENGLVSTIWADSSGGDRLLSKEYTDSVFTIQFKVKENADLGDTFITFESKESYTFDSTLGSIGNIMSDGIITINNIPSLISEVYTINNMDSKITNVMPGVDVKDFKLNLSASQDATFEIYESNGTTVRTGVVQNGDKVILTKQGTPGKIYTILVPDAELKNRLVALTGLLVQTKLEVTKNFPTNEDLNNKVGQIELWISEHSSEWPNATNAEEVTALSEKVCATEKALLNVNIEIMKLQIVSLENRVSTLEGDKTTLEATIATLNGQISELEDKVSELTETNGDLSEQVELLNAEIAGLQTVIIGLNEQITLLQGENDQLKQEKAALQLQIEGLQSQVAALEVDVSTLEGDKTTLEATIATLNAKISELESKVTGLTETNGDLTEQVEQLNAEIAGLQTVITSLNEQITLLQGENDQLKQEKAALQLQIDNLKIQVESLEGQVATLEGDKTTLEATIAILNGKIAELESKVTGLTQTNGDLTEQVEQLNTEIAGLQTDITGLNEQITLLQGENDQLKQEKAALQLQIDDLKEQVESLENQVANLEGDKTTLQATIDTLNDKITELESKVSNLTTINNNLNEEISDLMKQVADLQELIVNRALFDADRLGLKIGYAQGDSSLHVSKDLELQTSGKNGTQISWSSLSNFIEIDGTKGIVHRPSFTEGDAFVTLQAELTNGELSEVVSFNVRIVKAEINDLEAVELAGTKLGIGYAKGDTIHGVTQNLSLPTSFENGTSVSWTSNNPEVIDAAGKVTRPSYLSENKLVTLIATIQRGEEKVQKEFVVNVLKRIQTAEEAVAVAKSTLFVGYQEADSEESVRHSLILPTTGADGTSISWNSSNPAFISEDGTVTRPSADGEDQPISLTATITKDGVTDVKEFTLVVKKYEAGKPFDITLDGEGIIRTLAGLTATVKIERRDTKDHDGNEVVVFQLLKNGTEAQSIVAFTKDIQALEEVSAQFLRINGNDPTYSIKVFVYDQLTTDNDSMPYSLAEAITLK